jgi:YegS/Rv2252/BmrU family lipid kinase
VGGGDGTVSAVAGCLAGTDVALGLLPMGTANNFARGNDIPVDLDDAVKVIAGGKAQKVDLGRIGDGYFTNAVSLGLTTSLHRSGPERMKKRFGRAGYLLAATQRFAVHKPFRCRLILYGEYRELQVLDLRIANGPYYGSVRAVERADTHSGKLAVRIVKGTSKWTLGRVWAGMLLGPKGDDPACVETVSVSTADIEVVPPAFVSVDGEVVTQTPVRIAIAPKALNLIVP